MRRLIFFLFLLYILLHSICNKSYEVNKVCFADIFWLPPSLTKLLFTQTSEEENSNSSETQHVCVCVLACLHQSAFPLPLSGSLWLLSFFQISFIKCSSITPPFSLYPRVARQLQHKREGGLSVLTHFDLFLDKGLIPMFICFTHVYTIQQNSVMAVE